MKRNYHRLTLFICLLLIVGVGQATTPNSFQDVMRALSISKQKTAEFEEEKHAYYFEKPVISKGQLKFVYPDKLEKIITSPVREIIAVNGNDVSITKHDGSNNSFSISDNPVLQNLFSALLAILSGDGERLHKLFVINFTNSREEWALSLEPKSENVSKWVKRFVVKGDDRIVNEIKVIEVNGDYTLTKLYGNKHK